MPPPSASVKEPFWTGSRAWGPRTVAGTLKGREETLDLYGTYETCWTDYSTLPGGRPASKLRLLVIEVASRAQPNLTDNAPL